MADPRITSIEVHEYAYTLHELGKDYNGFNLVYAPGGKVDLKGYIIRIGTDVGVIGEYAGGGGAEYATLPSFAHYLLGKNALERELILRFSKSYKKTVLVEADKSVPVERVVQVFDAAKKLGAGKIGIAVKPIE